MDVEAGEQRDPSKSKLKRGFKVIIRSGDFAGRLATLVVMIITTVNSAIVTVTNFIEEVYWAGGIHLCLLLFIHIPAIVVLAVVLGKSMLKSVKKVQPFKDKKDPAENNLQGNQILDLNKKSKDSQVQVLTKAKLPALNFNVQFPSVDTTQTLST